MSFPSSPSLSLSLYIYLQICTRYNFKLWLNRPRQTKHGLFSKYHLLSPLVLVFNFLLLLGVAHRFSCNNIYEWCVLFIVQGSSSLTICECVSVACTPLIAIFERLIFTFKGCFECRPPRLQNCGNRFEEIARLASETICKRLLKVLPTLCVAVYIWYMLIFNGTICLDNLTSISLIFNLLYILMLELVNSQKITQTISKLLFMSKNLFASEQWLS